MNWRSLPKHKAHEIADRYNQKYDSMYWVTEIGKPETDKVPKGKE
jgi:acid phosphatase class B